MASPVECRNLIGGEWVPGTDVEANVNPSNTADIVGHYAVADGAAIDAAVEAARRAFPAWRDVTPQVRADLLDRVGSELIAQAKDIGRLLSREEGKTLTEGIGEVMRAGQIFKFFAQEALRVSGDTIASIRPGIDVEVMREPVGVVGLITPWNFPIAIPAWKIAPALAYGNCVIIKPAELTPGCTAVLARLLQDAGAPAGVFNLVMGHGATVGHAIVEHPDIDAISFTGSGPVGRSILAGASKSAKRVQLEMGGKNPTVIMDDADLEVAVQACLNSAFFSTGQRCTASSRLIVQKGIHDAFVDRLVTSMNALVIGDACDPATQIGPVVSERQLASNLNYVEIGRQEGAEVIGGNRETHGSPGFYQRPGLFLGASNDMRISREEIFGPLAAVLRFDDFEEGVAIANDTPYGLSSGICTTSLRHARAFKRRSASGMVMVNLPTAGVDYHVPFGGRKASSYGPREQGSYARDFYTIIKTCYTA
jgi:alpha-ketoglutaric semialdehyde dehydrogenase